MAAAGNLPNMIDILSRLPVKSLVRFSCIHKTWHSLFKSCYFVTKHLQNPNNKGRAFIFISYFVLARHNNNSNISWVLEAALALAPPPDTFHHESSTSDDVIIPAWEREGLPPPPQYVLGSCNGLVCLLRNYIAPVEDTADSIVLYNPSLKQHKILPQSNLPSPALCHPINRRTVVFGFGYDSTNNDYKVVREHWSLGRNLGRPFNNSLSSSSGKRILTEVFTLGTNSWRQVGSIPYNHARLTHSQCFFFNGAIHRLALNDDNDFLVSFDVCNEEFRLFSLPYRINGPGNKESWINAYGDLLGIFNLRSTGNHIHDYYYDIWVMKEENSWTRIRSITLPLSTIGYFDHVNLQILGFGIDGELILAERFKSQVAYFPDHLQSCKIINVGPRGFKCFNGAVTCLESLVSLQ